MRLLRYSCLYLLSVLFLFAGDVYSQQKAMDLPFTDGVVRALQQNGNTLFIGGDFRVLWKKGQAANYIAHYRDSLRAVVPSFPEPDGPVNSVVSDGKGGYFLAGKFLNMGDSSRLGIAHVDSNGQLSPQLRLAGISGTVNSLARIGDTLFLGGDFSGIGTGIADGRGFPVLDTSSGLMIKSWPETDGVIKRILPLSDRGWVISGSFSSVQGQTRTGMARFDSLGNLLPFAPAFQGNVQCMLAKGDTLFVAGDFVAVNGSPRGRMCAFSLSGGNLLSWDPAFNQPVYDLLLKGNVLYCVGQFTKSGTLNRQRLAGFNLPALTLGLYSLQIDSTVFSIQDGGSSIWLGGAFSTVSFAARKGIVQIDNNLFLPTPYNAKLNGNVRELVRSSPWLLALGDFTQVDTFGRSGLALFRQNGNTLDLQAFAPSLNGIVRQAVFSGRQLFLGGSFTQIDTITCGAIAVLDTQTWLPMNFRTDLSGDVTDMRLYKSGIAVLGLSRLLGSEPAQHLGAFHISTGNLLPWRPKADLPVNVLFSQGGRLFVGGQFIRIDGYLSRGLAELSPITGAVVPGFPSVNGSVSAIASNDTVMVVGGLFSQLGTQNRQNLGFVRLNTKVVHPWIANASDRVRALSVDSDLVLIGGKFELLANQNRKRLAAVQLSNGQLNTLATNIDNGEVTAVCRKGGNVLAGGTFTLVSGRQRPGLLRVSVQNNQLDTAMIQAIPGVQALLATRSGVVIAGDCKKIGGAPRSAVAAISLQTGAILDWRPQIDWLGSSASSYKVNALAFSGNRLYLGGQFLGGSVASCKNLLSINMNTGDQENLALEANDEVKALLVHSGQLWVGGNFQTLKAGTASAMNRRGIGGINLSTNSISSWTNTSFPILVSSIAPISANEIVVACSSVRAFTLDSGLSRGFGFLPGPSNCVYSDGTLVAAGGSFINGNSTQGVCVKRQPNIPIQIYAKIDTVSPSLYAVNALEFDQGNLYVGGNFEEMNGVSQNGITALNAVDGSFSGWYTPVYGSVNCMKVMNSMLILGGKFNYVSSDSASNLFALTRAFSVSVLEPRSFKAGLHVWPNPTQDRVFWTPEGNAEIRLFNSVGQLLRVVFEEEGSLSLEGFPEGMYFLHHPSKGISKLIRQGNR